MANQKKAYIIAPYCNTFAMYEANDSRLKNLTNLQSGKFIRTSEFRGMHNGYEIGIFECDNGRKYLIFTDHSAIQIIM